MFVGIEEAYLVLAPEMCQSLGCFLSAFVTDGVGRKASCSHVVAHQEITVAGNPFEVVGMGVHMIASDYIAEAFGDLDVGTSDVPLPYDLCSSA